ncbi:MAG: alpha/beta hydrolase [Bdellovibrionaceae bacterium]|nr:alpha/beta hydrolase [Pseudobdellovibrionaceae bacterium]
MLLIFGFFFSLIFTNFANARLELPTPATYESGRFLCEQKYSEIVAHEKGFYVTVPVDEKLPALGTTEVYAFAQGGFDPARESMVYFSGGPGIPAHWGLFQQELDSGLNVIIIEQRGIGCSRPTNLSQYLNPRFYGAELVARDAEAVRKFLKITRWGVYGLSYGTVPATIYASLFPQATRALVLEGTMASGGTEVWEAPHRRKLLQKMLDSLPNKIRERMEQIVQVHHQPDIWFSRLTREMLMANDALESLKSKLLAIDDEQNFAELLKRVRDMFAPLNYTPHVLFAMNDVPYYMNLCRELSFNENTLVSYDSLIDGQLVPTIDHESIEICRQLAATKTKTYQAADFPVSVPVTYFQGSNDSATAAPEAIRHYKSVPTGARQLLILVKGGHSPNLTNIRNDVDGQKEMFFHAIRGDVIPKELLNRVRDNQPLRWTYTSKNF